MQPKKQTKTLNVLIKAMMISWLIIMPISQTLSAEDMEKCQPCVNLLENCVEVAKKQKKAINSQKIVIKKQKELINEQKTYIVKKEADASFSKILNGILAVLTILVML
jgi:chemotaxis regulatin CheY-phosphate phosphatase CheZ